jgi:hypothetical protein
LDQQKKFAKPMQRKREPYKGSLNPEKAAMITHEVSMSNMKNFPKGADIPKDSAALSELNKQIRERTNEIYKKNGTDMQDMMHFISSMDENQRARYNKKLTELFMQRTQTANETAPAAASSEKAQESAPVSPTPAKKK